MWTTIITVALTVLGWFIDRNKEDKELQELFFKFVEKVAGDYLNSVKLRDHARKQLEELRNKPWEETQ